MHLCAALNEQLGVHITTSTNRAPLSKHMATWRLPEFTMLRTDYAKFGVTTFILYFTVVVFITVDLPCSLDKEFEVIIFARTFWTSSSK